MKSFNRIKQLSNVVCDYIEKNNLNNAIVADIATDHGYLSELLSRNNNIKKIIATDISQKCLDKTEKLIRENNLTKIETKLGDGLDAIDFVDVAVIAGVGGYEIVKMLRYQNKTLENKTKSNVFVLQPSKNCYELRKWLIDNKFEIVFDKIVESGDKFYPIIVVDLTKEFNTQATIFNLYFGKSNTLECVDFVNFLKYRKEQLSFLEKLSKNTDESNDIKTKREILNIVKDFLKKIKGD